MQNTGFDSGAAIGGTHEDQEKFVPNGAIAFFMILLLVYALMWFSIYFDMLSRR